MYRVAIIISLFAFTLMAAAYLQSMYPLSKYPEWGASQTLPSKKLDTASDTPNTHITTQSGLIAYVSLETGELTTQAQADSKLAQADSKIFQSRVAAKAQQDKELPSIKYTTYANGMVRAQLNGHFMVPQIATIDCQGELHTKHAEQLDVAENCKAE